MKHLNEEELILYHYGENGAATQSEAEQHLAECSECKAQFDALQQTLAAVDSATVPERPADYELRTWQRIAPRLDETRGFDWRGLFRPQRLVVAGALATLLIVAFFAGRISRERDSQTAQTQPATAQPDQVRERILIVAVGEHLERSQMMLVELINTSPTSKVDISSEQQRAEELVGANRLYRQTAAQAGETGVASVLEELERVLLEIAHSPTDISARELETLRKKIEARGILFKVRVIGSQMQQRQQSPVVGPGSREI